jgi:Raf kinase inhibitor-like YbhB/YbcL family protein
VTQFVATWTLILGLGGFSLVHAEAPFRLTSSSFKNGNLIPPQHTCEGKDRSPSLTWESAPAGTKSFVLIVDDPDAPDPAAPKMTWVHWVLYNIPASSLGLPENVSALPAGTAEGLNDWKRTGYSGPCPPIGKHRYFFKLYALDTVLTRLDRPTKVQLEQAIEGHVLAQTELIGTYRKHG